MDWLNQKIAKEQFESFAKGIINTTFSKRELYQREINIYKYWRDVCKKNNYIYSACLESEVQKILNNYYQNKFQNLEQKNKHEQITETKKEEKEVKTLEYVLN